MKSESYGEVRWGEALTLIIKSHTDSANSSISGPKAGPGRQVLLRLPRTVIKALRCSVAYSESFIYLFGGVGSRPCAIHGTIIDKYWRDPSPSIRPPPHRMSDLAVLPQNFDYKLIECTWSCPYKLT